MSDFSTTGRGCTFARRMLLGIDYGTRRVGVAGFCPQRDLAPYPYDTLRYRGDENLAQRIAAIVAQESAVAVVLGVPHLLDGRQSSMSRRICAFGRRLEALLQTVPIYCQDETLTSFAAEERMQSSARYNFQVDRQQLDALAAVIILEDFMTEQGPLLTPVQMEQPVAEAAPKKTEL